MIKDKSDDTITHDNANQDDLDEIEIRGSTIGDNNLVDFGHFPFASSNEAHERSEDRYPSTSSLQSEITIDVCMAISVVTVSEFPSVPGKIQLILMSFRRIF